MVRGLPAVGDIVVTTEAPLGEVAQLNNANVALAQRIVTLRGKKKVLNNDFLLYLMQSRFVKDQLESRASGSTVMGIKQSELRKVLLPVPPEPEQLEIAKHLKALDNKIELNRQTNQTLEQIAQAIFKSWFVDFDPVRAKIAAREAFIQQHREVTEEAISAAAGTEGDTLAHAGAKACELAAICAISGKTEDQLDELDAETLQQLKATAALFPDALVDSELGEIPERWTAVKLKEICRVINGRAYKNTEFKEQGTPIVRIQNLSKSGKTVYSDLKLADDKLIDKEDFIYAWSATFGPYIWRGPESIYHYHIWKMDVNEEIVSRYFLYLSMFRKTEKMKNAGTGSIFTHLTKKIMEDQDILIATPALNERIKYILESAFKMMTTLETETEELLQIQNVFLPKLLSGELAPENTTTDKEAVA